MLLLFETNFLVEGFIQSLSKRRDVTFVRAQEEPPDEGNTTNFISLDITPASFELDGARKAFALYNSGLISRNEVSRYAKELADSERTKTLAEEERIKAQKAIEKAKLEAIEKVTKKSFDFGATVTGVAINTVESVLSTSVKATSNLAKNAVSSAKNAVTSTTKSTMNTIGNIATGVVDTAVDGIIDFTIKKPLQAIQKKSEEIVTAPQRNFKKAVDQVNAIPVRTVENIQKKISVTNNITQEKITKIIDTIRLAPQVTKDSAVVATKLATGATKLALKSIPKPENVTAVLSKKISSPPTIKVNLPTNTSTIIPTAPDSDKIVQVVNSAAENAAESARRAAQRAAQNALNSARESVRGAARQARQEETERQAKKMQEQKRIAQIAQRLSSAQASILNDVSQQQISQDMIISSPQMNEQLRNRTSQVRELRDDRLITENIPQEPPKPPRTVPPALIKTVPSKVDERKAASIAKVRLEEQLSSVEQSEKQRDILSIRDELVQQSSQQAAKSTVVLSTSTVDDDDPAP